MKKITILCCSLLFSMVCMGQNNSIFGKWKTIDDQTGEAKSIIEIYKKGTKAYGKIVDILNPANRNNTCIKCEGDEYNKPLIGLDIIKELVKDGNAYEDGTIFDPEKGKTYKAKIWVDEEDPSRLNVRGYISFLFRTQQWVRSE